MERLTKPNTVYCKNICDGAEVCDGNHDPFDLQCAYAKIYDRLAAYEDTGLEPEEIEDALSRFSELLCYLTNNHMSKTNYTMGAMLTEIEDVRQEAFERYCDLKQAEIEGRLVVLPCKAGDTVYQKDHCGEIYEAVVQSVVIDKRRTIFITSGIGFDETAVGKAVFLTRAEAEKAMEVSE